MSIRNDVGLLAVTGFILYMFWLVSSAPAGSIDNSATRPHVAAEIATHAANTNLHIAAGNAYNITSTGSQDSAKLAGLEANRYPTNLAVGVTDPWHVSSNILSYSVSTVTLTRAMGEYIALSLTNNATLCIDQSSYPTNGAAFIQCSLYIGSFSLTFCTNSISTNGAAGNPPGSAGVTLTNTAWNSILLHRPYGSSNVAWGIRQ